LGIKINVRGCVVIHAFLPLHWCGAQLRPAKFVPAVECV
jgi:hypothetical protein